MNADRIKKQLATKRKLSECQRIQARLTNALAKIIDELDIFLVHVNELEVVFKKERDNARSEGGTHAQVVLFSHDPVERQSAREKAHEYKGKSEAFNLAAACIEEVMNKYRLRKGLAITPGGG